jgi:tetratricopeptide (TPR) repeat protein
MTVSRKHILMQVSYNGGVKNIFQKILLLGLIFLWGFFFVFDYHVSQWVNQADQYMAARQPDSAEALFLQVAQAETWRSSDWNGLAQEYFLLGRIDNAVNILERLEDAGSLKSKDWSILAQAYQKTGQVEKVEPSLLKANSSAETADEKSKSLLALIQYYRQQFRFEDALFYQKQLTALENAPEESWINEILLQTIVNPEEGLSEWQKDPTHPAWLQQWGEAVRLASTEPEKSARQVKIGRAYAAAGQWDLAEFSFEKSTEITPDYAEAWGMLAEARQQQEKNGRNQIEKALELAPQSPAIRLLGALYYRRQFDYKKAVALLQQNTESQPTETIWFLELGQTLASAGRFEEAVVAFEEAVRLKPDEIAGYVATARFCAQFEYRLEEIGLPAATKAVSLAPDSGEAYDTLGQVYFALGKYDQAADSYNTALDNDPLYAPAWLHIGQMALSEQDSFKAKESLKKVITLAGNSTEGRVAARLLKQYFQISSDQAGN